MVLMPYHSFFSFWNVHVWFRILIYNVANVVVGEASHNSGRSFTICHNIILYLMESIIATLQLSVQNYTML